MSGTERTNSREDQLRKYKAWTNLPGHYQKPKVTTDFFLLLGLTWSLIKIFQIFSIS